MSNLKDSLLDLVKVLNVLSFEIIKVTGNEGKVIIQSRLQNDNAGAVFLYGKLLKDVPEFDGVFGLSNIPMLVGLTNVESFRDKESEVSVNYIQKGGVSIPEEIVFKKTGFGKASYRLTGEKAVPKQSGNVTDIEWDIEIIQPPKKKIQEFSQMAGVYSSQESRFSIKTEQGELKFLIGDENASTHKAFVVFAENVTGRVTTDVSWNISGIISVLKLASNYETTLRISNHGILQVEINTGLGIYSFMFAGSK